MEPRELCMCLACAVFLGCISSQSPWIFTLCTSAFRVASVSFFACVHHLKLTHRSQCVLLSLHVYIINTHPPFSVCVSNGNKIHNISFDLIDPEMYALPLHCLSHLQPLSCWWPLISIFFLSNLPEVGTSAPFVWALQGKTDISRKFFVTSLPCSTFMPFFSLVLSFSLEAVSGLPPWLHISNFPFLIFSRSLGASFHNEVLCQEAYKYTPVPILICLFLLGLLGGKS